MNIYSIVIMLGLFILPHLAVLTLFPNKISNSFLPHPLLFVASLLYPLARYLPEPNITEESITLLQHFVGGGFISVVYFYYLVTIFKPQLSFVQKLIAIYFFASGMGVANELLEFGATFFGIYQVDGTDVWWDLLSNTLGAYFLFFLIEIVLKSRHRS